MNSPHSGTTLLNSSLPLALGQPSQCLPHSLTGIHNSSTSPDTPSSDLAFSFDSSWQFHVLCWQCTKHVFTFGQRNVIPYPIFHILPTPSAILYPRAVTPWDTLAYHVVEGIRENLSYLTEVLENIKIHLISQGHSSHEVMVILRELETVTKANWQGRYAFIQLLFWCITVGLPQNVYSREQILYCLMFK